jgi:DNA-binding IclR family transcriptional regulator
MRGSLRRRTEAAYHHKECSRPVLHAFAVLAAMPVEPAYAGAKDLAHEVGFSEHRVTKALYTLSVLGLLEYDARENTYRVAQWPS